MGSHGLVVCTVSSGLAERREGEGGEDGGGRGGKLSS